MIIKFDEIISEDQNGVVGITIALLQKVEHFQKKIISKFRHLQTPKMHCKLNP
jgi:hypothetical protein